VSRFWWGVAIGAGGVFLWQHFAGGTGKSSKG
jgi:hypothetical protein